MRLITAELPVRKTPFKIRDLNGFSQEAAGLRGDGVILGVNHEAAASLPSCMLIPD